MPWSGKIGAGIRGESASLDDAFSLSVLRGKRWNLLTERDVELV